MPKAKRESSLFSIIVLTLIAALSAAALGAIYEITKEPIAESRRQETIRAIKAVLGPLAHDNEPFQDKRTEKATVDGQALEAVLYPATKGGAVVGAAVPVVSHQGFSGDVELMVGVDGSCHITTYVVLRHQETPGLGDKMKLPRFKDQFQGKGLINYKFRVRKDGGDVDAITAATITSRAVADGLQRALTIYQGALGKECQK